MALYLFALSFKPKIKWGNWREKKVTNRAYITLMDFQAAAQQAPLLPLPPVGWISLVSLVACGLNKNCCTPHIFSLTRWLYFCIIQELGHKYTFPAKQTNKWMKTPPGSFYNVSLDKTPCRDILLILLFWTKPTEWGSEQAGHIPTPC